MRMLAAVAGLALLVTGCGGSRRQAVTAAHLPQLGPITGLIVHLGPDDLCPAHPPAGVTNQGTDLRDQLVPLTRASRPITSAHICRWGTLDQGSTLIEDRHLDEVAAAALAATFNRLPPGFVGERACPADFGSTAIIVFAYGVPAEP